MKTKVIYVLVSSPKDIYLEQAWVSIWSLRHFNPEATVQIVTDKETAVRIDSHRGLQELGIEVVKVDFAESVSNKERSRWLKTSLRSIVDGSFLFIDTDTVVTDDLSGIDAFDFDLGMVYDWHCPIVMRPNRDAINKYVKMLFGRELKPDTDYYNSGVIFCRDTEFSHHFFERWHKNWLAAKDKPRGMEDQQSLVLTIDELGGMQAISGDFNCQPIVSMAFIATAKIMHFFNTRWSNHLLSPLYDKKFFEEIKSEGDISSDKQALILHCKSAFVSPCMAIMQEDIAIWKSSTFKLLRKMYSQHVLVYKLIAKMSSGILKLMSMGGKSASPKR